MTVEQIDIRDVYTETVFEQGQNYSVEGRI